MRAIIMEKEHDYENSASGIRTMLNDVNEIVVSGQLILSHVTVDDIEVYNDISDYLFSNTESLKSVEFHLITVHQLLINTLGSTADYINRSLPELHFLIEEFYSEPTSNTWHKFGQLIEGITWFTQTSHFIQSNEILVGYGGQIYEGLSFTKEISTLDEAVAVQDSVMIGDIINYEIVPRFEDLFSRIKQILENGVMGYDLN